MVFDVTTLIEIYPARSDYYHTQKLMVVEKLGLQHSVCPLKASILDEV